MALSLGKNRFYSASLIALASSASATARVNNTRATNGANVTHSLEIITTAARLSAQTDTSSGLPTPPTDLIATEWASLYFGKIAPGASTGEVTISYMGEQTCDSVVTCLPGQYHAARFGVMGEAGYAYVISVDTSTTVQSSGANTMQVNNIAPSHTTGILVEGYSEFYIGGDLTVAANQAPGHYSGTYQVSVDYQ